MPLVQAAPKIVTLAGILREKGYTEVRMKRRSNASVVRVQLNGRPLDLVVDTGASSNVIHSDVVNGLGINFTASTEAAYGAFDKIKRARRAGEAREFTVGTFAAGPTPIKAMFMGELVAGLNQPEGLLGIGFLNRYAAIIDCFGLGLFLKQSPAPVGGLSSGLRAGGYTEIAMRVSGGGIVVPVTLGTRAGYLIVDTGAPHTLLDEKAVSGLNYTRFGTALVMGDVGGDALRVTRLKVNDMRIGAFPVPTQEVATADLELVRRGGGMPGGAPCFGFLGQDLLAFYVGIIDCGHLRLFLRLDPVVEAARKRKS